MSKRAALASFTLEGLGAFLQSNIENWPDDAEVVSAHYDFEREILQLKVKSEVFSETPEGYPFPTISVVGTIDDETVSWKMAL